MCFMLNAFNLCSRYPHHTEVQAFLELFAEEFGVRDLVQFNTRVVEVRPLPGGGSWCWQCAAAGGLRCC